MITVTSFERLSNDSDDIMKENDLNHETKALAYAFTIFIYDFP